jgi:hypothetical protein
MNFSNYTVVLKAAIGVVIFLFGAFSGFLMEFAPPDPSEKLRFQIGIAQFISLVILLFISLLCNYQATKKKAGQRKFVALWLWISAALIIIFTVSSIMYYQNFSEKTIMQSDWDTRFVKGELTPISKEICEEEDQNNSLEECEAFLLYKYYNSNEVLDKHFLWTQESVNRNSVNLLINYIIVIASISGTLFSLVELLSWSMFSKKSS